VPQVLVTGGAGFLGSYVVRDLLRAGEAVVAYDTSIATNVLDHVVPDDARDALTLVQGEVTDGWALLRICERESVDRIVHLAAPLTDWVRSNPPAGLMAMCGGTATLLEVARALSIKRVAWTSSIAVYGRGYDAAAGRASPRRPDSLYGSCKVLCEDLAAAYRADLGVDSIGLRFPVLYGPWRARGLQASFGQDSDLIRTAALGDPVVVRRPRRTLNWLYVEDASDLLLRSLRTTAALDPIYDASGEVASMLDLAGLLRELAPLARVTVEGDTQAPVEQAPDDAMVALDDSALRAQLGWEGHRSLRHGVAATLEAYVRAAGG
jgi:nucleoside-diphosphate-sugar epimerase